MEGTIYSIIPPLVTILMVILFRKVLLSLLVGSIVGALMINEFSAVQTGNQLLRSFIAIFVSDGSLNTWNVYILLFLVLLGIISAFISITGGSRAFGKWAENKIKSRKGSQFFTAILGLIIFIDDYFNSLAVGQISRPLTDRYRVSRAKLAYLIDSTSAPICVISPVSSWGAYIIGIIGTILVTHNITGYSALSSFIQMIPLNFYVIVSISMVFVVIWMNVSIGSMKKHEHIALSSSDLHGGYKGDVPGELKTNLPESNKGSVNHLILPILALILGTIISMIVTGWKATDQNVTLLSIFENTDVAASLLFGGIFGAVTTFILFTRTKQSLGIFNNGLIEGIKSMLPAIYILIFAWVIVDIIDAIGTGTYLSTLVERFNLSPTYLPALLFILSGIIAFSTGTSWGTFGVMLPIAGELAATVDVSFLLPSLAAVLAGSVFGDHCSPISDTTILSSTGAGSHHISHVLTQLPYALISAFISIIGYLIFGLTGSVILSIAFCLVSVFMVGLYFKDKTTFE